MAPGHAGPLPWPEGAEIRAATGKGLTLACPAPVGPGAILEFDLLLGARPLPVMARVVRCGETRPHAVEVEFVAIAQVDRDILADFLTAVGPGALRARSHRED